MRLAPLLPFLLATAVASAAGASPPPRKTPYWASISASKALMRTGPGRNYPAVWKYHRPELPVRVLQVHQNWRRVQDPSGAVGWMDAVLLSAERTAIVKGRVTALRGAPDGGARLLWKVAPGVVGKIRHCERGWCEFEVRGRAGYVQTQWLWGVSRNEVID